MGGEAQRAAAPTLNNTVIFQLLFKILVCSNVIGKIFVSYTFVYAAGCCHATQGIAPEYH